MKTLFNYRDFADPESYIRAVVDEVISEINAADPMTKAYQKAYARLYFRMKTKKISALNFKAWQNTAKTMMTVASNEGEKQKEEVINWLNKY